jgi:ABC-type lipoprotein release transport system permease subunit
MNTPQNQNHFGGTNPEAPSSSKSQQGKPKNRQNSWFLVTYAWKNLSRHRKRTMITAGAIAFGLMFYLFLDAWLLGAELDSKRNLRRYETSSARVYHRDNWETWNRLRLTHLIESPQEVLDLIRAQGFRATPRVSFQADLIVQENPFPTDGSITVRAFGIDVIEEQRVYSIGNFIESGRYPEPGEYGLVLGAWLARELGAEIGYPITLVTRTREGFFQTLDLEVMGIVNTPNPMVNRTNVFLPIEVVNWELQMAGAVTDINIAMGDRVNTRQTSAQLEAALNHRPELGVYPWEEIASDFLALSATKEGASSIMLFLVFIIAAVGISNTMLMAVFERIKELGTLRAIGMRNKDIRNMFLMEAGGIGFLGSVMGLALGSVLIAYVTYVGIDLSFIMTEDVDFGYRLIGVMYGAWNPQTMVLAFFVGILMSAVVAYLPTRRALNLGITECLRDD